MNGGNITEAARQVGYNPSYARSLMAKHPALRGAIQHYKEQMASCLAEWAELLPKAKATLLALLHDPDARVRYLAAKDIIDRAEGKPVGRMNIAVQEQGPALTEGEVQLAFALMQQLGWSYAEAVQYIQSHPHEVQAWIRKHTLSLPAEGTVVDNTSSF